MLNAIATSWIACNSGWMRLTQRTAWDVQGVDTLAYWGWYLVNCNHQSWVDIFVLQHVMNQRIPMLKFFPEAAADLVPVIGLAWWALELPMKRHVRPPCAEPGPAPAGPLRDHAARLRNSR